jgi:hypothetical protein
MLYIIPTAKLFDYSTKMKVAAFGINYYTGNRIVKASISKENCYIASHDPVFRIAHRP